MPIKKLSIDNLSSFVRFRTDEDFQKHLVIYGTNGAGKSTLTSVLQLLDDHKRKPSAETAERLRVFLKNRLLKEGSGKTITLDVESEEGPNGIQLEVVPDRLGETGNSWTPIRVFNEEYTSRTIGQSVTIDFQTRIAIGQTDLELEKLRKDRDSLVLEKASRMKRIEAAVQTARVTYQETADSGADVAATISTQNMLLKECRFQEKPAALLQRKKLSTGKVAKPVEKIDSSQFNFRFRADDIERHCQEVVMPPSVDPSLEASLRNFTSFFQTGVGMFEDHGVQSCPFCRRPWPDGAETVGRYKEYLLSTYNSKREKILADRRAIEEYKRQVVAQIGAIISKYEQARGDAEKYQIDLSTWKELVYDESVHQRVCALIDAKHGAMDTIVSVQKELGELAASHRTIIELDNALISKIQDAASSVSVTRRSLNSELVEHFAATAWKACKDDRESIDTLISKIAELSDRVQLLEDQSPSGDTIREVFNRLAQFMGISEYSLDEDRKLRLLIDREYDISNEGVRISSAQRKLLSLCYFFAEILSEVKDTRQLKKYCVVFDDPVDSADYIHFYSIASLIENVESIIGRILGNKKVRLGQIIVLTHNSLLFERLAGKWADQVKSLQKLDSVSTLGPSSKVINNYSEYIREICKYCENPTAQKRRMIYVGNLIRRVLEILASFDSLGSNNFHLMLEGAGREKLALVANHMSHESFTRVLNPLSVPEELKIACLQLLDVIREKHPGQYASITSKYPAARLQESEEAP